eukprot:1934338-Rhodomonas_salina.1
MASMFVFLRCLLSSALASCVKLCVFAPAVGAGGGRGGPRGSYVTTPDQLFSALLTSVFLAKYPRA